MTLVSFEGRIEDPSRPAPRVWVIPFPEILPLMKKYAKGRMNTASRRLVLNSGDMYENAWGLIGK